MGKKYAMTFTSYFGYIQKPLLFKSHYYLKTTIQKS